MRKYTFTDHTKSLDKGFYSATLRQIVALKDFGNVKAGTLGGYIECEANLDQDGTCWVSEGSIVYGGRTRISGDAWVGLNTEIGRDVIIKDNANITNSICLGSGNTTIVGGGARLHNGTSIVNTTVNDALLDSCHIYGLLPKVISGGYLTNVEVCTNSRINIIDKPTLTNVRLLGNIAIGGDADIREAQLCGDISIGGDTTIWGPEILGDSVITGGFIRNDGHYVNAVIKSDDDFMVISGLYGGRHVTIHRTYSVPCVHESYRDHDHRFMANRMSFEDWANAQPDSIRPFVDILRKRFG